MVLQELEVDDGLTRLAVVDGAIEMCSRYIIRQDDSDSLVHLKEGIIRLLAYASQWTVLLLIK